MKLDITDMKIIRILQENSRIPLSEIAKNVRRSRPTIRSRIEKLKKEGIIKKFTAIINRDAIMENILVFFNIKARDAENVAKSLSKKNEILEAYTTSGGKNIICKAFVKNVNDLKVLISKIEKTKGIKEIESFLVLKTIKEEYETEIGSEIGALTGCDSCGKSIHPSDDVIVYKLYNREYFFCCPTCLKKFKDQMEILREIK